MKTPDENMPILRRLSLMDYLAICGGMVNLVVIVGIVLFLFF